MNSRHKSPRDNQSDGTKNYVPRRDFLAAATALAATAWPLAKTKAAVDADWGSRAAAARNDASLGPLAIDGGTPVRATRLGSNYPGPLYYDEEERRELLEVLDRRAPFRWYGIGPKGGAPDKCNLFEKEFAAHQHTKYCVAVTSGTAALITAMAALDVGPGDEVILPAWTWHSCYDAVIAAGATPVFAEIDDSFNIDPTDIERHITPRTKVIMAVHVMGEPADMDAVLAIARRRRLKVLEDCAQSLGATYQGHRVGSMGDCGIYSFQLCKTITAGEGGALVTNDPYIFERAARFHDIGTLRKPHQAMLGQDSRLSQFAGMQFRMSEYTGAVMRAQLRKLDRIVSDFRARSTRVAQGIADLPGIEFRKNNDARGAVGSSVYFRTQSKDQRDRFIKALEAENIPADAIEGSVILPIQPYVEKKQTLEAGWPSFAGPDAKALRFGEDCCPRTMDVWKRYVGVPMDPTYSEQDVSDIIAAVCKVYTAVRRT
jgi:8-amino-3,8-dideoxy-alpha-D-manno-octulosonate transaminase